MNWNKKSRQIWTRIKKEQKEVGNGNQDVSSERKKKKKKKKKKKMEKEFSKKSNGREHLSSCETVASQKSAGITIDCEGGPFISIFPSLHDYKFYGSQNIFINQTSKALLHRFIFNRSSEIHMWMSYRTFPPPLHFLF